MSSQVSIKPRSHWHFFHIQGPDALDFLHRLSTIHVKMLQQGRIQDGFILTPQGKILSAFKLWRLGQDEFGIELDGADGQKERFLKTLEQFTFAEKYTLTERSNWGVRWLFELEAPSDRDVGTGSFAMLEDGFFLAQHGINDYGRPWRALWGEESKLDALLKTKFEIHAQADWETLEEWRIENLSPRVGEELTSESNPLELGLIHGISRNKGCYPGQETIERTLNIGSPAKRLVLIKKPGTRPSLKLVGKSEAQVGAQTPEGTILKVSTLE